MQETSSAYERVRQAASYVREKTYFAPKVALTLGSGLGGYADEIKIEYEIDYRDIPGFPVSTVAGHDGRFVFGYVGDVPIVAQKGRVHYYEGYDMEDVVLPARLMHALGAEIHFLSNAAGGLGDGFRAGDLMLITDHISSFVRSPLIGPNDERFGTRFPDMSEVYDRELSDIVRAKAKEADITLKEGVYLQLTGPSYETPAEIRMIKALGASAVGMSTVVEAIADRHMGVRVVGVSLITNLAAGISKTPLSHAEVQEAADAAAPRFTRLVTDSIKAFL